MDKRKVLALWPKRPRPAYDADPIREAVSVRAAYAFGDWPPVLPAIEADADAHFGYGSLSEPEREYDLFTGKYDGRIVRDTIYDEHDPDCALCQQPRSTHPVYDTPAVGELYGRSVRWNYVGGCEVCGAAEGKGCDPQRHGQPAVGSWIPTERTDIAISGPTDLENMDPGSAYLLGFSHGRDERRDSDTTELQHDAITQAQKRRTYG